MTLAMFLGSMPWPERIWYAQNMTLNYRVTNLVAEHYVFVDIKSNAMQFCNFAKDILLEWQYHQKKKSLSAMNPCIKSNVPSLDQFLKIKLNIIFEVNKN